MQIGRADACATDPDDDVARSDRLGIRVLDELERIERAFDFSRQVLLAAGARQIAWSGLASTHVQGTCRMGDDPEHSVVDRDCESHEVKRLYVGDGSVVPRTLSVNPSLTIMALATRLAEHLDADPKGYLVRAT